MGGPLSKALVETPYPAILSGPFMIRETVYGIVKRLRFFIQHIEAFRLERRYIPIDVSILDVGCGTGVDVTIPLARSGYSVTGMDLDVNSIEQGRRLAAGLTNVDFRCGTPEVEQPGERFDVIICSEVLEHVEDPKRFLAQLGTALKEGGLLLVTVPNGFGYFELESVLWRLVSRAPRVVNNFLYRWENRWWRVFGSEEILRRRAEELRPERLGLTQSTLAADSEHRHSFTRSKMVRLVENVGLGVLEIRNGTFLAGNLLGLLVRELDAFLAWNSRVADRLPACMVSGWMFAGIKVRESCDS